MAADQHHDARGDITPNDPQTPPPADMTVSDAPMMPDAPAGSEDGAVDAVPATTDADAEQAAMDAAAEQEERLTRLFTATIMGVGDERIGKVGQVYLDDQTQEPNWITARTGLFGTKEFFVPLDEAQLDGKHIVVPYTKAQVTSAPATSIDQNLSPDEEDALYNHYRVPGRMTEGDAEGGLQPVGGVTADVPGDGSLDQPGSVDEIAAALSPDTAAGIDVSGTPNADPADAAWNAPQPSHTQWPVDDAPAQADTSAWSRDAVPAETGSWPSGGDDRGTPADWPDAVEQPVPLVWEPSHDDERADEPANDGHRDAAADDRGAWADDRGTPAAWPDAIDQPAPLEWEPSHDEQPADELPVDERVDDGPFDTRDDQQAHMQSDDRRFDASTDERWADDRWAEQGRTGFPPPPSDDRAAHSGAPSDTEPSWAERQVGSWSINDEATPDDRDANASEPRASEPRASDQGTSDDDESFGLDALFGRPDADRDDRDDPSTDDFSAFRRPPQ